jgi:isopenicillin N synthase-like dioxygenase
MASTATAPLILADLRDWRSGHPARKAQFVADISKAFREIGFVALTGHSLSEDLTSALYAHTQAFFALPQTVKERYHQPHTAGQRGYTPFGIEKAKDQAVPDLKEFFQWGREPMANNAHLLPNPWVDECPEWNMVVRQAYRALEADGQDLMRAIALGLKLEEGYFDSWLQGGDSILRAIHYPPLGAQSLAGIRSAEHEDINLITLLMGASAEGLEVQLHTGEWMPIAAGHHHLIVNAGDMLQRATNGLMHSTTHRVVNPTGERASQPRYSLPFFVHPAPHISLKALPGCTYPGHPSQYPPITAGEFLRERLAAIGLTP